MKLALAFLVSSLSTACLAQWPATPQPQPPANANVTVTALEAAIGKAKGEPA